MTTREYLKLLERLGLSTSGHDAVRALGLSRRQLIRIAHGQAPVPETLARLLILYLRDAERTDAMSRHR